jgi:hypothetical protein
VTLNGDNDTVFKVIEKSDNELHYILISFLNRWHDLKNGINLSMRL